MKTLLVVCQVGSDMQTSSLNQSSGAFTVITISHKIPYLKPLQQHGYSFPATETIIISGQLYNHLNMKVINRGSKKNFFTITTL